MANTEINNVLNNPYMGWAPWAEWGPYPQPHRLVYAQFTWGELEPAKGNFNWSALETRLKFSYWKGRNIKIVLRFMLDLPGSSTHRDIPDWLFLEINQEGTSYKTGLSPNYKNSALISNHARVISALAERYNNDPGIAFVEIGSLGHWGENHTVYLVPSDAGYMPPIPISNQYVQHYINSFTNKKLLMRRPFQIAKDNRFGLYNDMFGNPAETERFIDYFTSGYSSPGDWGFASGSYPSMPDFWQYSPSGGEVGDCPGSTYFTDTNIQRTVQYAVYSHTSWIGPCAMADQPVGSPLQNNIDSLMRTVGYRFVLQSVNLSAAVNAGDSLNVAMQWNNKGVAPFYYLWPLELSLSDNSGNIAVKANTNEDIRTWLPGTKSMSYALSIPSTLAPGTYSLCTAILDPDTGNPGVDFAMTGRRPDGRYDIGTVTVAGSAPNVPPVITNISAGSVTSGGAVISWATNEAADSQVEYGTTTSYGSSSALVSSPVTAHSIPLTGLQPSTTYYYRVKSRDGQGSLATSGMNSFTTAAVVILPTITIDGNASDWSNINALSTTSIVYSLKLTNDTATLNICVQGQGLNVKSQFYIDTDVNSATGYKLSGWSSSGCEYLLENNYLHRYTGNGSTWSWSQVGTVSFAQNDTVIEASVPLSSMNLVRPGSVRIGFVSNNSSILRLPAQEQALALYTLK
jgi:hypothetical protein